MTKPQRLGTETTFVEDFYITCGAKHGDRSCDLPATWYVELHKPHFCGNPAFNDNGNRELFVCIRHLEQLEKLAEKTAKQFRPPWWIKMFRDGWGECSSCHRTINHAGDILQVVLGITQ